MEQDSLGGFYELLTGKHRCYRWKPGRFPLNKNEPGPSAGTFALAFLYMILFGIVLAAAVIPFNTYYVRNFIETT